MDCALQEAELAADACFRAILSELMATTAVRVLLAVDEYSELFQPSLWKYKLDEQLEELDLDDPDYEELAQERRLSLKTERIPAERLTMVAPFMAFQPQVSIADGSVSCNPEPYTPANGAVVCAATENFPVARRVPDHRGLWPRFEERFGASAEPWTVRTPRRYSEGEFWAAMDHYRQCDMVDPDAVSLEMMQRISVKTARNPKLVFHKCSYNPHG
jgi:Mitochondrial ribosomal death-associated protein 3